MTVSISSSVITRSWWNCPRVASVANHGGIERFSTARAMERAQGRVCWYVIRGIGAIMPPMFSPSPSGRWQVWQFSWRTGRTSA